MSRLRVAVLVHEDLIPPDSLRGLSEKERQPFKREWAVGHGLRERGHEVRFLGVSDDLIPIRELAGEWQPHVVFNLLNEFQDVGAYQAHVTSYLELLHLHYTGCNPTGLLLSRDKSIAKKILRYHRIATPAFRVIRRGRPARATTLHFPLIVKTLDEEASMGISQASIVRNEDQLEERVGFVHEKIGSDALVEEYVEGRELTLSVLGNERLRTFPIWEMWFDDLPEGSEPIATAHAKWDLAYQKRVGVSTGPAETELEPVVARRIHRLGRRVFRALELSGFARLDLRLTPEGRAYVIEANAAPDLSPDEDFALSAQEGGLDYPALLQRIVNLAMSYRPRWQKP